MNSSVYELVLDPSEINFAPETEVQEILQNVMTICTTAKYSVPMDRDFGIEGAFVDDPVTTARAAYTQEIVRAVRKFEPRARISRVDFSGDNDGKIVPRVFVKIVDVQHLQ